MQTLTKSSTMNILLVEDDEVDILNVKRTFRKNKIDHCLYVASNGLEALDMLRNKYGDLPKSKDKNLLILLDINMPKMNGIEFLRELRKDTQLKAIPVIVFTTSDDDQDKYNASELNVAGYMIKPIDFQGFTKTITILNEYWNLSKIP